MSGGDVVCSGWLRKSPPEKKLRRYWGYLDGSLERRRRQRTKSHLDWLVRRESCLQQQCKQTVMLSVLTTVSHIDSRTVLYSRLLIVHQGVFALLVTVCSMRFFAYQ
ncbi:unnamed protein product [Oncorhynchus mykiss]|uniref:Uncharacterized protein n=1 Tax=Oncorhynchus mykiss TaxID=8022 RepID=A0A060YD89_ONCMY|nr:unnamed protein product [Oncorhynchus mykiss]